MPPSVEYIGFALCRPDRFLQLYVHPLLGARDAFRNRSLLTAISKCITVVIPQTCTPVGGSTPDCSDLECNAFCVRAAIGEL